MSSNKFFIHVENLLNNPEPVEVALARSTDMPEMEFIDGTRVPSLQPENVK